MSLDCAIEAALTVVERYGDEVLTKLLTLAPLVAGSGNAWRFAIEAMEQGDDGLLVIKVPGLPGEPPEVTWMGAGWRVVVEPARPQGHHHPAVERADPDHARIV